jgi:hypothetical protein
MGWNQDPIERRRNFKISNISKFNKNTQVYSAITMAGQSRDISSSFMLLNPFFKTISIGTKFVI